MRTDIHRPSMIEPADYDFVAFEYLPSEGDPLGDALFLQEERKRIRAHMARTGGNYSGHEHGGNCHVCGSVNAIYTALFHHTPSNVYVRTGLDCAAKLECRGVEAFRSKVADARERKAGKAKAQATLQDSGASAAWAIYTATDRTDWKKEEETVADIVGKLVQYGSLSPAQMRFVATLLDRVARRAEIEAQRKAEHEAAAPVPHGDKRITVRGKVLTIKVPEYGYDIYGTVKMLVQTDAGWKVWGSLPSSLSGIERGTEVEFSAKVKPSDRDPKFGFFSRPTKARVVAA